MYMYIYLFIHLSIYVPIYLSFQPACTETDTQIDKTDRQTDRKKDGCTRMHFEICFMTCPYPLVLLSIYVCIYRCFLLQCLIKYICCLCVSRLNNRKIQTMKIALLSQKRKGTFINLICAFILIYLCYVHLMMMITRCGFRPKRSLAATMINRLSVSHSKRK